MPDPDLVDLTSPDHDVPSRIVDLTNESDDHQWEADSDVEVISSPSRQLRHNEGQPAPDSTTGANPQPERPSGRRRQVARRGRAMLPMQPLSHRRQPTIDLSSDDDNDVLGSGYVSAVTAAISMMTDVTSIIDRLASRVRDVVDDSSDIDAVGFLGTNRTLTDSDESGGETPAADASITVLTEVGPRPLTQPSTSSQAARPPRRDVTSIDGPSVESPQSPQGQLRCPICMDGSSLIHRTQRKWMSTNCGHIFCDRCLMRYLNDVKKQCPTCRKRLYNRSQYHPIFL